jgi:hypothetical protein
MAEAKPKRLLDSRAAVEFSEEEALNGHALGEREPGKAPLNAGQTHLNLFKTGDLAPL